MHGLAGGYSKVKGSRALVIWERGRRAEAACSFPAPARFFASAFTISLHITVLESETRLPLPNDPNYRSKLITKNKVNLFYCFPDLYFLFVCLFL